MTASPPPRRKWTFARWFLVLAIAIFGWSGWKAYAFRSALAEAKELGWTVHYTDPVEMIRKNWKSAFKKETWLDGATGVHISTSEAFEQNAAIVHRLNPKVLRITKADTLRDLSALKPLSRLQEVELTGCTGLSNVDAFANLSALQGLWLYDCSSLTNVDALKNHSVLEVLWLDGCKGLTNVDALKDLPALQVLRLNGCTGLANVDALKNLPALQSIALLHCKGLTNVDGLKNLSSLNSVSLFGCTGLTPESFAALRAAMPNAKIYGP